MRGPQVGRRRLATLPLLGLLLGLAALSAVVRGGAAPGPGLAASCTSPALVLAPDRARAGQPVRYAVVGPEAGGDVVLAVDAASLRADLFAVPVPGLRAQVLSAPRLLRGCRLVGAFRVDVGPGRHVVTAYRVAPGGAVPLAAQDLVVRPG